jgi:hypothetical protein
MAEIPPGLVTVVGALSCQVGPNPLGGFNHQCSSCRPWVPPQSPAENDPLPEARRFESSPRHPPGHSEAVGIDHRSGGRRPRVYQAFASRQLAPLVERPAQGLRNCGHITRPPVCKQSAGELFCARELCAMFRDHLAARLRPASPCAPERCSLRHEVPKAVLVARCRLYDVLRQVMWDPLRCRHHGAGNPRSFASRRLPGCLRTPVRLGLEERNAHRQIVMEGTCRSARNPKKRSGTLGRPRRWVAVRGGWSN